MSELTEFRKSKDHFMGHDHHSPLTGDQKKDFHGLNYYDENRDLSLVLVPEKFDSPETIEMQTSTGDLTSYLRWGKISFEAGGEAAQMTLFKVPEDEGFFLPFADGTSGGERPMGPDDTWKCSRCPMNTCWWTLTMPTTRTAPVTRDGVAP